VWGGTKRGVVNSLSFLRNQKDKYFNEKKHGRGNGGKRNLSERRGGRAWIVGRKKRGVLIHFGVK